MLITRLWTSYKKSTTISVRIYIQALEFSKSNLNSSLITIYSTINRIKQVQLVDPFTEDQVYSGWLVQQAGGSEEKVVWQAKSRISVQGSNWISQQTEKDLVWCSESGLHIVVGAIIL